MAAAVVVLLALGLALAVFLDDPARGGLGYLVRTLVLGQSVEEVLPRDLPASRLEELLGHREIPIHVVAANRLLELGSPDPFLRGLESSDSGARGVSAHWLQSFPRDEVRSALRSALGDADEHVRMWAAFSLGKIGTDDDAALLSERRPRETPVVGRQIDESLAEIRRRLELAALAGDE